MSKSRQAQQQSRFIGLLLIILLLGCQHYNRPPRSTPPPRSAFQFYYQALDELQNGQLQNAIAHLDSAIRLQPGYSQFYCVKGRVYQLLQQPDSAIVAFEQCLQYKSFHPQVWIRLGKLYLQQKQFAGAARYLEKSIQYFPDSTHILLPLGKAYVRIGQWMQARDVLTRYNHLYPSDPEGWKWLGLTYFGLHRYEEAVRWLQDYLHTHSQDGEALRAAGIALFRLGRLDEGLSHLNRLLQIAPDSNFVFAYRARYFLHFGKRQQAREQLELGLARDSTCVELLLEAAKFYLEEHQPGQAHLLLKRALNQKPRYWILYKYLGMVAEAENRLADALNYYTLYMNHILKTDREVAERLARLRQQLQAQ